ncbi:hypothetical protein ABZP36_013007 [Zizania latifolia]
MSATSVTPATRLPRHHRLPLLVVVAGTALSLLRQRPRLRRLVLPLRGLRGVDLHVECLYGAHAKQSAGSQGTGVDGGQSNGVTPSRRSRVAKFLLKAAFRATVNAATGSLASPVLDVPVVAVH